MKISQTFNVSQPPDVVWTFFQNIPELAECMPGASLNEDKGDGVYTGQVAIKLGPFTASFEGEAKVQVDETARTGHAEGKGFDKRGGSRSKLVMDYALKDNGAQTEVSVDADVQLSGPIAQFGRAGVIEETAKLLIGQFVTNLEAKLASAHSPATGEDEVQPVADDDGADKPSEPVAVAPRADNAVNGLALMRMVIAGYFKRLFSRKP
ncbi:MAG: SRPBCC family protein [Alphaproteobacteria bacterium]|nr:SRPBCC family protein [Alphaproteobacteria bacterium]